MSTESVLYPLTALKYGYMRNSHDKPNTLRKFLVLNYFLLGIYDGPKATIYSVIPHCTHF